MRQPMAACFLLVQAVFVCACISHSFEIGGGASVHHPPEFVIRGQPVQLTLTQEVWGEGSGAMSKRYRKVTCHYKTDTRTDFQSVSMVIERELTEEITWSCVLPVDATQCGHMLEYYFDYTFDGHKNDYPVDPIPILDGLPGSQ